MFRGLPLLPFQLLTYSLGILLLFPALLPSQPQGGQKAGGRAYGGNEEERRVIWAEQGAEDGGPELAKRPKKIMLTT